MTALNHWGIAPLCLIIKQSNKKGAKRYRTSAPWASVTMATFNDLEWP
jgi:hypothetical protein